MTKPTGYVEIPVTEENVEKLRAVNKLLNDVEDPKHKERFQVEKTGWFGKKSMELDKEAYGDWVDEASNGWCFTVSGMFDDSYEYVCTDKRRDVMVNIIHLVRINNGTVLLDPDGAYVWDEVMKWKV